MANFNGSGLQKITYWLVTVIDPELTIENVILWLKAKGHNEVEKINSKNLRLTLPYAPRKETICKIFEKLPVTYKPYAKDITIEEHLVLSKLLEKYSFTFEEKQQIEENVNNPAKKKKTTGNGTGAGSSRKRKQVVEISASEESE